MLETISTPVAPAPGGHYSQAVVANGFVFVAGQLPFTLNKEVPAGIKAQAALVLKNLRAILEASGSRMDLVVSVQIFVSDLSEWPSVNEAFSQAFGAHKPARTVVPCGELRHCARIEANAVAVQIPTQDANR